VGETSPPVVMAPTEKPAKAESRKEADRRERNKKTENRALSITLLVFFVLFLIVFGYSVVTKRKLSAAEETPTQTDEVQSGNFITVPPRETPPTTGGEQPSEGSDSSASGDTKDEPTPPNVSS
jgi:hypothetical protein